MSTQMSLLDAVPAPRPVVVASREAIVAWGCNAPGVPAHEVLPFVPGVSTETAWAMLVLVERAVRYNAAPSARIDGRMDARNGVGSNGPIASGALMSESKGLRQTDTREFIPWTRLLAALRQAREMEPETARARDLAEARRLLHHYAAYGPDEPPAKLLPRLREEIAALGGDLDEPTDTSR